MRRKTGLARVVRPSVNAIRLIRRLSAAVDDHDELAEALAPAQIPPDEITGLVAHLDDLEMALRERLEAQNKAPQPA